MKNLVNRIVVLLLLIPIVLFFTNEGMIFFGCKSFNELPRVANEKFVGFNRGGSATKMELPIVAPGKINTSEKDLPALVSEKVNVSVKGSSTGDTNKTEYRSLQDVISFVPKGIFTALFRPLPGEVNNVFGFLAGVEGAFLLILFSLAIKRMRWRELLDPIVIWAILVILAWATIYAFVSYNLGTICRYRLQILPIFLGLLLYLSQSKKMLQNRIQK